MSGLAAVMNPPGLREAWGAGLPEAVSDLAWAADGSLIAGGVDGQIRRFAPDGKQLAGWPAHRGGVTRVCPSPGAGPLASAGEDGCVRLWPGLDGETPVLLMEEPGWVEHLAWAPDGSVLAAAAEKAIFLWRGEESAGVWYDARRRVLGMAWAPDARRLATASNKGLFLWSLSGGEPMQLLQYPGASVSVAWAPRGDALAVGTQDGFLMVWRRAAAGEKARALTMRGYPGKVTCVAWHPLRTQVASAGGPDLVIWDVGRGATPKARPLRRHAHTLSALAYAPDGGRLVSVDRSGLLCLWEGADEPLQTARIPGEATALRWREDGRYLALGSIQGEIRVFCAD